MQDDPFGAPFPLCESDFSGPDSRDSLVRWLAETQFDATLFCPGCQTASPPAPPVEALPQAPQGLAVRLLIRMPVQIDAPDLKLCILRALTTELSPYEMSSRSNWKPSLI